MSVKMKKIFSIFLFLLLLNHAGLCQDAPVELSIKPDRETYEAGDKIILEVTFKNISKKDIIVYWNHNIPEVQRTISEGKGSVMVSTSESLFPELIKMELGYKESGKKTVKIPTVSWEPGVYQLKMQYIPPNIDLNLTVSPNQEILVQSVDSNTVTIKVTGNQLFKGY